MVESTESARQYPFTLMKTGRISFSATQVNKLIGKILVLRLAFGQLLWAFCGLQLFCLSLLTFVLFRFYWKFLGNFSHRNEVNLHSDILDTPVCVCALIDPVKQYSRQLEASNEMLISYVIVLVVV